MLWDQSIFSLLTTLVKWDINWTSLVSVSMLNSSFLKDSLELKFSRVTLVGNVASKSFNPICWIRANFRLIYNLFMTLRRIVITLSLQEVQNSRDFNQGGKSWVFWFKSKTKIKKIRKIKNIRKIRKINEIFNLCSSKHQSRVK